MRVPSAHSSGRRAFSLIEILVVIGLAVALMSIAAMSVNGIMIGARVSQSGQMVMDTISLARQEAVRSNREVQVIFLKIPLRTGGDPVWRGVQMRTVEETVTGRVVKVLNKAQILPPGMIISEDATLSPLLTADSMISGTITVGEHTNVPYRGIRFRPGGNLDSAVTPTNNFLTLNQLSDTASPPTNYFTLQINPVTGAVRSYRP
jgi:uncharacterized protein (TIGR02596 family)